MKLFLLLSLLLSSFYLFAQPGSNDANFNIQDDGSYGSGSGFNFGVNKNTVLPNGKIVVIGGYTDYNGEYNSNYIIQLLSDGKRDINFTPTSGFFEEPTCLAAQSDNKIIVGGDFTTYNGANSKRLVRINADGSKDATFSVGTGPNGIVNCIKLQSDGKLLVGGSFTQYNGTNANRIVRVNTNGSIDASFNSVLGFNGSVFDFEIQSDGKIVVIGVFSTYAGNSVEKVARLNVDGTLDVTFNSGTGFNFNPKQIEIQTDGKMLFSGDFNQYNGQTNNGLIRVNVDGTQDLTFSSSAGFVSYSDLFDLSILSSGKIVLAGNFASYNASTNGFLCALNSDGTLDTSFDQNIILNDVAKDITVLPNDDIIVTGLFNSVSDLDQGGISKISSLNQVDPSLNAGTGFDNIVNQVQTLIGGKTLVAGDFTKYNGTVVKRLCRLNLDGSLDTSFDIGLGFNDEVINVLIQTDGKMIVTGSFTMYQGQTCNNIIRLNPDASIDPSFNVGTGFDNTTYKAIETLDGKLLVLGYFTSFNGNAASRIIKLDNSGNPDLSFSTGTGFDAVCFDAISLSSGQFIIAGAFNNYNGTISNSLCRLNSDGSIDNTFNIGTGFDASVYEISLDANEKIIAGGSFEIINGNPQEGLARLMSDGSFDATFTPNIGNISTVYALEIQADGKILIGGSFYGQWGTDVIYFLRINPTGFIDNSFTQITELWGYVYSISAPFDGKVVIGGAIEEYGTIRRNRIARIYTQTCTSSTISGASFASPSDTSACTGELAVYNNGTSPFQLYLDGSTTSNISFGYNNLTGLCPGVHDLITVNDCSDSLFSQFVIPVDSNYFFNNPSFTGSVVDSLGNITTDCTIFYNSIDTAFIDSLWLNGIDLEVIWNIYSGAGIYTDTSSYTLNSGNGIYYLQYSIFCPTKTVADYFAVTEAIKFENGTVSYGGNLSINEIDKIKFGLFPNPTSEKITVQTNSKETMNAQITDFQGNICWKGTVTNGYEINTSSLKSGVYFFQILEDNLATTLKLVKY